jgi:ABC-type Fe3+/spermidine/putrescine transport system ATPase subunit
MIEVKNLSLHLGGFSLKDINLAVRKGEYFVLLGPTGAGKTVLMECLAGLHHCRKGEIWLEGKNATSLAPEERRIGYVPQDYALFPFLNVWGNIIFGLKQKRYAKDRATKEKLKELTRLLGISHLLDRDVRTLSGGEKQRVALARALATSPRILLLDEPLSSLDVSTAKYLRLELRRLHQELGITTVHVTHNLMEAEELADRIAVFNQGRVEQVGTPEEVFFYPRNQTVSDFIGTPNVLNCDHCHSLGNGLIEVVCGGVSIILPGEEKVVKRIALFPRDIYVSVSRPPGPELNRFKGVVTEIKFYSSLARVKVKIGEICLLTELPQERFHEMGITLGREVYLILKLRRLMVC